MAALHSPRLAHIIPSSLTLPHSPLTPRRPATPRYTGIHIGPPCLEEEYRQEEISPQQCRLRDITYAAPIYVDVEYTRGREIVTRRGPGQAVRIGRMPLMLRCDRCGAPSRARMHCARAALVLCQPRAGGSHLLAARPLLPPLCAADAPHRAPQVRAGWAQRGRAGQAGRVPAGSWRLLHRAGEPAPAGGACMF